MKFTTPLKIRFGHVDPAGIVFYPRYFEFFNTVIEEWCEQALGAGFNEMHTQYHYTLPVVHAECEFFYPSRLGDNLQAQLSLNKIGNSSVHIEIHLVDRYQVQRIRAHLVLVLTDLATLLPIPLTPQLRQHMLPYLTHD